MKKEWDHYFENPDQAHLEDTDMAELFQELRELESPDPGSSYWNHFNANLQARIDTTAGPKHSFLLRFRGLAISLACLIAATILFFYRSPQPSDQFQSLGNLSMEELRLLEGTLDVTIEDDFLSQLEWVEDAAVEDLYLDGDDLFYDINDIDNTVLDELMKKEG